MVDPSVVSMGSNLMQGGLLLGSFFLGFVSAVFAEPVRRFLFKPKLNLRFSGKDDCVAQTPMSSGINGVYVRVKVTNLRRQVARSCRAFLNGVEKQATDGRFQPTIYTDSLPLAWSCQPEGLERSPLDLLHGVSQYVDVVAAFEGGRYLEPQVAPFPRRYFSLFADHEAIYRFTIQVSGDGVDPRVITIDVNWKGQWNTLQVSLFEP